MNLRVLMVAVLPILLATGAASAQTAKPGASAACATVLKTKVNLNKASVAGLQCLPGMTKAIAKDVVMNRPFKSAKDFEVKIETIGRKLYAQVGKYVTF